MIYFKASDGKRMIVLSEGNLKALRAGKPAKTPDGEVLVLYMPDVGWVSEQIGKLISPEGKIDSDKLNRVLEEGSQRPEREEPYHEAKYMYMRTGGEA